MPHRNPRLGLFPEEALGWGRPIAEAVEGPPRTSCAVRQPPRNRTSRPCFCAAASLLQRMRLPPFFALYSPFLRPSFPFFSLLPFCVFLHASPPGGVRARGGQKKAPGRKESSPAKHPCSNRYGRVALRLPQRLRRAFFTQKREKLFCWRINSRGFSACGRG